MTDKSPAHPLLPGAIGLTHLRVYQAPAPDGRCGGSPHVHLACSEAYLVVAGRGAVQTLDAGGPAEIALEPGRLVWFTPGVIHRLTNLDGELEIVIPMQNAGLPEAGDAVLTMPQSVLADDRAYQRAAAASTPATPEQSDAALAAAHARRDMAVDGYVELLTRFEQQGPAALRVFLVRAAQLIAPQLPVWRRIWEQGPLAEARHTGRGLDALGRGDVEHLMAGRVSQLEPVAPRRLGMCGTLGTYQLEGRVL
jgi:mannose-6-phosphate isomerase-like protein (cupin superfamily)